MHMRYVFLLFVVILASQGCVPSHILAKGKRKQLKKQIEQDSIFNRQFTGFALYDPVTDSLLVDVKAHHYFTPASNTKILTLATSLQVMGDSLPLLRFLDLGDTILIRGTGYPGIEYGPLPEDHQLVEFLRSREEVIAYADANFYDDAFGPGWSWGDYQWYYQAERNDLPLFGNVVRATGLPNSTTFQMWPVYFNSLVYPQPDTTYPYGFVWRETDRNVFHFNVQPFDSTGYERDIPVHVSPELTRRLLSDLTGKTVIPWHQKIPGTGWTTLMADLPADSIYRHMMQVSDNYLAEQLLLTASGVLTDSLQSGKAIDYMLAGPWADLPDQPQWVDGSGLSRYNLNTPASLVEVLGRVYRTKGLNWIQQIFPVGGKSGTIAHWYSGPEGKPYVWAKTGSLLNNHCLSGFILTRSGKVYVFSFMNNHFTGSANAPRRSMQRVLEWMYWNL